MIFGIPDKYRFILASRSPRRQQLLRDAGLHFDVRVMEYEEKFPENLTGKAIAEYLSSQKAQMFRKSVAADEIIITADTIVWCNGMVLDKPADYEEAFRILTLISGNTHEVITGVTLLSSEKIFTFSETTNVTFDTLSHGEIDYYITNYKPFDKAGAYGIQEWIGLIGNSYIEGSYFNVMGLPVNRLIKEITSFINK